MPLPGGAIQGSAFTQTNLDKFIPELWSSEVQRALNAKLLMMDYVARVPDSLKKGDLLHIPKAGRLAVNPKLRETPVQLQTATPTEFTMTIDRYIESSLMFEDLAMIQSNYDARSIYTSECGLAMARDIDNWILAHRAVLKQQGQYIQSQTSGAAPDKLNQSAVLGAKLLLEKLDVDSDNMTLIVSPAQYVSLLQVDAFVNKFYNSGDSPITTGVVGEIYGIKVVRTNALKKNTRTGYKNGDAGVPAPTPGFAFWNGTAAVHSPYWADNRFSSMGGQHTLTSPTSGAQGDTLTENFYSAMLIADKDWLKFWMQLAPNSESSREVLFQADAVVQTQYYGCKVYRPEFAVVIESNEAA